MKKFFVTSMIALAIVSCTSRLGNSSKLGKTQASITGTQWVLADDITNRPTLVIEQNRIQAVITIFQRPQLILLPEIFQQRTLALQEKCVII